MERTNPRPPGAEIRTHHHWWQRHDREASPLCELEDDLIGADYYAEMGFLPPAPKAPAPVEVHRAS
jgi:hypothetical protein